MSDSLEKLLANLNRRLQAGEITKATYQATVTALLANTASPPVDEPTQLMGDQTLDERAVNVGKDVKGHIITGDGSTIIEAIPGELNKEEQESHYLKALTTRCGGLDLTTLSASEASKDTLSIDAVFTTLYLEGLSRAEDQSVADLLVPKQGKPQAKRDTKRDADRDDKEQFPVTATEAVAHARRLVILGQPGGGKSTLVNYIASQLAEQRRNEATIDAPNEPATYKPLPVRIILRRFADWLDKNKRRGEAGDVWDYFEHLLSCWGRKDCYKGVRETLLNEGGIFFFDGLDEIRSEQTRRAIIKGAVTEFAATETQCQIVVMSRPYAYTNPQWQLPEDQFVVVSLAPFGEAQIEAFNTAWYSAVMGPRRDWSSAQCQKRADRLTRTILARPHLRRLAASPLLLTLIAQVDSSGTEAMLPRNRAELYRQTVDLLLARWENRIQLDDDPGEEVPDHEIIFLDGLPTQKLRDVLAQLAYEGHEAQSQQQDNVEEGVPVEIAYDTLRNALLERFDSLTRVEEIILYIQHRTGLLVDKGEGVFTFPHRTYQEYLAGQHLQNTSGWQARLIKHVKKAPDWWREVFLLSASSISDPDGVQYLVKNLLPNNNKLTQGSSSWLLIAAQALVETNFLYYVDLEQQQRQKASPEGIEDADGFTEFLQSIQAMLKERMIAEAVLPPKVRAEAGRWLAELGDERPGVGVITRDGVQIPHILWSAEIPAGTYTVGDTKSNHDDEKPRECVIHTPYRIAKYPITQAQFQAFIDAPDGKDNRWWNGLPEDEQIFTEPRFPFANHPRERVSWYQTIAFCRWLTAQLHAGLLEDDPLPGDVNKYEIVLPDEFEWEVAACWPNDDVQERIYPWGADFDSTKANTREGDNVGQTTAVGIYPSGKNATLDLYDLSGNVLEWCCNKFDKPEENQIDSSGESRVVRGGSWHNYQVNTRAAARNLGYPGARLNDIGFRVVVRCPPSHDL